MDTLIGLLILAVIGYYAFNLFRGLFRTWKITVPVIFGVILLGILVSKGVIKTDDASGFMAIVVIIAIFIVCWAFQARCPRCKTYTVKKVGERHLSTSGVYQQKSGDGHYHPHQKITGEDIYRCSKCGYERRSRWTKSERLDL